ncbi:MAG: cupin domain-containing protein [Dehalococcoidia bacterium]|nr:cupin domain-containing protein [Dehalococcoidia bacterium]
MPIHVLKAGDGDTAERGGALFEGGRVWTRGLAAGDEPQVSATVVHFEPGARAGWHRHSTDQLLYVVSGIGKVGGRDGETVIAAGDSVLIPANTDHWHGAHDTGSPMSHLSITPAGSQFTVLDG